MATIKTNLGIELIRGAIDRKSRMVMRVKTYKDPLTGEVIGYGPNECYYMSERSVPLSEKQIQHKNKFKAMSDRANEIYHNTDHPRYNQLYTLYREQLQADKPIRSFANFICSTLYKEMYL